MTMFSRTPDASRRPDRAVCVRWLLACVALTLAPGCLCSPPKDAHDGVIDAPVPIETPISSKPACVVRIEGTYYDKPNQRTRDRRSVPRYAKSATFTVGDKKLELVGKGGHPVSFERGETWVWTEGEPAPDALRGYDKLLDGVMRCTDPGATCSLRNIRITEHYIPCQAKISMRGEIRGEQFLMRKP